MKIRFMVPCHVQCEKCGEIIPQNRKFNGEKLKFPHKTLAKISVFHLKFHCPRCHNLLILETDPINADYLCHTGCHKLVTRQTDSVESAKKTDNNEEDTETKTDKLEARLEQLQRNQLQMDELTQLQLLQSKLHANELKQTEIQTETSDSNGLTPEYTKIKQDDIPDLKDQNNNLENGGDHSTIAQSGNLDNEKISNLIKLRSNITTTKQTLSKSSASKSLGIVKKKKKGKRINILNKFNK